MSNLALCCVSSCICFIIHEYVFPEIVPHCDFSLLLITFVYIEQKPILLKALFVFPFIPFLLLSLEWKRVCNQGFCVKHRLPPEKRLSFNTSRFGLTQLCTLLLFPKSAGEQQMLAFSREQLPNLASFCTKFKWKGTAKHGKTFLLINNLQQASAWMFLQNSCFFLASL